jgi:hypothetical protein
LAQRSAVARRSGCQGPCPDGWAARLHPTVVAVGLAAPCRAGSVEYRRPAVECQGPAGEAVAVLAAERPAWDVTPRPVAARAAERPARDVSSQAVAARASRAVGADVRDPHRGPAFPRDAHEAVSAQRSAEPAASEQPVAAAGTAERDAPPGAVVVGAAERDARPGVVEVGVAERDARPEAAAEAEVELPVVAAGLRWAVEAVQDEAPRREAVRAAARPSAAAARALPSAAASACRRDRALPSAPGPQRWVRPRHAMQSLQIALPSAQSWQAAGNEVWSCGIGSRSQRKRKSAAINKYGLGRNVAALAGEPGYIFAKHAPSLEPCSWRIQ